MRGFDDSLNFMSTGVSGSTYRPARTPSTLARTSAIHLPPYPSDASLCGPTPRSIHSDLHGPGLSHGHSALSASPIEGCHATLVASPHHTDPCHLFRKACDQSPVSVVFPVRPRQHHKNVFSSISPQICFDSSARRCVDCNPMQQFSLSISYWGTQCAYLHNYNFL